MKLGFYLFAEYINMFISSAVMATLFFGGYDIPFVNDATLLDSISDKLAGHITGIEFVHESGHLYIFVHVGTMDDPAIPV